MGFLNEDGGRIIGLCQMLDDRCIGLGEAFHIQMKHSECVPYGSFDACLGKGTCSGLAPGCTLLMCDWCIELEVQAVAVAAAAVSSCCRSPDESVTRVHHEEVDNLNPS